MTLVILAAGMGSRYGGLKQIDPLGPNGEFIIDYSIYDAKRAGFDEIAFIIKEENFEEFKETIGNRVEKQLKVSYIFQNTRTLPSPVQVSNRLKPWGTAHALWCCKGKVKDKFAVINADDFYGNNSYKIAADYLNSIDIKSREYAMIGFMLKNTLSDSGTVARGLCTVGDNGILTKIDERLKIIRQEDGVIRYTENDCWFDAGEETIASMNFWAFTPEVFKGLEDGWDEFIEKSRNNLEKAEFLLPTRIGEMINEGKCTIKVLSSPDKWHGVTYKDDRASMVEHLNSVIADGTYPEKLWN